MTEHLIVSHFYSKVTNVNVRMVLGEKFIHQMRIITNLTNQ